MTAKQKIGAPKQRSTLNTGQLTRLPRWANDSSATRPLIQSRLTINQPGDAYEQEANRVAEQVIRMPEPRVQRKCAKCEEEVQRQSLAEEEDEKELQMKAAAPAPTTRSVAPPAVRSALNMPGRPLDAGTRAFMEPRFGHDFSHVRVHTDPSATESARAINARAYTVGNNVVFGAGQYAPATGTGRQLLAHELVHVVQQRAAVLKGVVQTDLAIPPTVASPTIVTLSNAEIADAITYNRARYQEAEEIALLRDILGLSPDPAEINEEFVLAVVQYQADFGLDQDGKLGPQTVNQLSREMIAEATFLGPGNLGDLAFEFRLKVDLQALIDAGNTTYADYRTRIQAATIFQRNVALLHTELLTNLRDTLSWNNFARCVELLGRQAFTYWQLIGKTVVRRALRDAWNDSNPAVPAVGTTQHEEGGWVFMNLITGDITTRRAAAGGGAAINLTAPPTVADSIVIAKFHTHPNLGPAWDPGPSGQDTTVDAAHGVPDIVVGSNDVDPATFDLFPSGPNRRQHLAGNRGLPGAGGGLAPQAKRDGTYDEQ